MGIERQKMKDEDFAKMILGMMEARGKERMLGIRVLIIAHNAYKFQGCAQTVSYTHLTLPTIA